ncbi:uncharacterized protein MKZ38_009968 [Zalerion maritima]|uniref:Uncharacterized protein n=1 Tax=Zalerion maritima TaxID=339359 RepID=A0AAD5WVE3_9PEZI|nr:uncharacterized protein MKZ38_009968 [Zalerion maritima]
MMDLECSPGAPLQPVSPERVNQQRESSLFYSTSSRPEHLSSDSRDSSVHDKISQFNTLSMQSRQLERKTADAALNRAMLGREEAETEMRLYRDEARSLRKQLEDGRERERRVGERLETVMENYGRAKETYAHTQALWEKEIRRARKETFKSQSGIVKLQEELKSVRSALKSTEDSLEHEKERSKVREQEAFAARYQLVGVQEELENALEQIKQVEQERDAFKTLAKNEEVARIAAEGHLPLPPADSADDEFASPKKPRVSISTVEIQSSAASEAEIEELSGLLSWEMQRANRAVQEIEFLKAECELNCCPCSRPMKMRKNSASRSSQTSPQPVQQNVKMIDMEVVDPADLAALGFSQAPLPKQRGSHHIRPEAPKSKKRETRRSTVFIPSEGTFRTVSQEEAEAISKEEPVPTVPEEAPAADFAVEPRAYARTPSVDPPTFAVLAQERASLQSLLEAPHQGRGDVTPTLPVTPAEQSCAVEFDIETPTADAAPPQNADTASPKVETRPHTSASFYTVTQTTTVPLRESTANAKMGQRLRTPKSSSSTFDVNNPAFTPTMTREEALAQIRERRGRARSMANGTMTPRRQMVEGGGERRDVSAPVGRGDCLVGFVFGLELRTLDRDDGNGLNVITSSNATLGFSSSWL